MSSWAEHVKQSQSLKITQRTIPPASAAAAAGALPVPRGRMANSLGGSFLAATAVAAAATYDPICHAWRVRGVSIAGTGPELKTRVSGEMAGGRCSPQRLGDSLPETYRRLFTSSDADEKPAHPVSKRVAPRPVRESPITPVHTPEPLRSLAKRYAVLRNFDPLLGRYVDGRKEDAIAAAEAAEAAAAGRRRYERAPRHVREHADRGPRGVIFDDTAATAAAHTALAPQ